MNQILHIFKKDTRRFWLEILLSTAILFAFVWLFPEKWKVYHDQMRYFRTQGILANLSMLVPLGWWLLVARVVLAESLVGDEQFWITRPYEWKKLLAAKSLFLVVWLGVPYLLAESWLLATAGFHPLSYVHGLLSGLLVALVVIALPALAVATVASTFARLTMIALGGVVAYLGFSFWTSVPAEYTWSHPYGNRALPVILLVGCVAVIVLQYATRRVWISRAILLALPFALAGSVAFYNRPSLVDQAYPPSAVGWKAPISISFAPTSGHPAEASSWDAMAHLLFPVHYAGIADGTAVFEDDVRFTITAANGSQWSSPWQSLSEHILPDQDGGAVHLKLRPEVYTRFKSGPVTLKITFAVSQYQADSVTRMPYPAADAAVPGIGFCTRQSYGQPNLHCRAAIDVPRLTHIRAMWSKSGCSNPAHLFEPTAKGNAWAGPVGFDPRLSLVVAPNFWVEYHPTEEEQKQRLPWEICPGSPLILTTYHSLGRGQVEMTLTNFVLPDVVRWQ